MATVKTSNKSKAAPLAKGAAAAVPARDAKPVKPNKTAASKSAASKAVVARRSQKAAAPSAVLAPALSENRLPKAYLALVIDAGIFLIGALPEGASKIVGLGFYADGNEKLVLCCQPAKGGVLLIDKEPAVADGARSEQGRPQELKFLGFLPIPAKLLGSKTILQFGAVQEDGIYTRFPLEVTPMQALDSTMRESVMREYRHLFGPAVMALVPANHPLRKPAGAGSTGTAASAVAPAQGFFDEIVEGRAEGWAFDPAHPGQRLIVEIMEGERVVARGIADRFRDDLLNAGIGDGRYCYKLPVSYALRDGKPHTLTARVAKTRQALQIKGGGPSHVFEHAPVDVSEFDLIPSDATLKLAGEMVGSIKEPARQKELAVLFANARLALDTRELADAARGFLDLLHKFGEQPLFFCKLAESYVLGGRHEDAVSAYRKAIDCAPEFGWAWLGLGGAQRLLQASSEAQAAYRKSLELMPESRVAGKRLAQSLISAGNADEAITVLKSYLLQYPDDEEACTMFELALCPPASGNLNDLSDTKELRAFEAARQLLDTVLDAAEAMLESRK